MAYDIPVITPIPEQAYKDLVERIRDFQERLEEGEELAVVAGSGGIAIHVETLTRNGQMVTFDGVDGEGRYSRLIQHYTQTNIQLLAVKPLEDKPRKPTIGF